MKIEHIAMYVHDLEGAKNFFCEYFEATSNSLYHNKNTGFRSYFLTFTDGSRLEIMNQPGMDTEKKPQKAIGYAHIAFSVGSKENVDTLSKRLREDGYPILSGPRITGDGYYESCIIGFEGNLLEITV